MFSDKIIKPTLVVSKTKAGNNIQKMREKARKSRVHFRPHFKTHQSVEVGDIFREKGVDKITVSSVTMAEYFTAAGWDDITIAFVVNLREFEKINMLAKKVHLNLLTDSVYATEKLSENLTEKVNIFIKTDTGYHRTGLVPESKEIPRIIDILRKSENTRFAGFLTHAGNTYHARGKKETLAIMEDAKQQLQDLKQRFIHEFPDIITSYGDTPSCSMAENCHGFDEIRPGNFVYYDVMQYHLGSCAMDDIAAVAACPVVSVHPERDEMVIYGGAVHLSKETIEADHGFKLYGYVVNFTENGWSEPLPGTYVSALSQEHGIIKMPEKFIRNYKPGDLIGILPVHSCLTADLLRNEILI